jgi:hypothetical protein
MRRGARCDLPVEAASSLVGLRWCACDLLLPTDQERSLRERGALLAFGVVLRERCAVEVAEIVKAMRVHFVLRLVITHPGTEQYSLLYTLPRASRQSGDNCRPVSVDSDSGFASLATCYNRQSRQIGGRTVRVQR